MKRLSPLFFLLLTGSSWLFAQDTQVIGPFDCGLNNTDNSASIPANCAQDLLNVDLSLGGRSVKKREGYGLAYALGITTSPPHGIYDFYDLSGNDIALAFNDVYMTAVVNGGSPTVLSSTEPLNATWQCVDSQGFAYCANTSRDRLIKTNGVTQTNQTIVTTGTLVAVTPDRLVLSGFGTTAPNRIDFSAAADFTSWTTGVSATSAFQFTIAAPGSHITHITYAFNRIMWFKDTSFGYILPGATASDWVVKTISPNVGTLDNTSVYYKDILYFRGQDSHIWSYDGVNLVKLTRDIGTTIGLSQSRTSNSWTQSSQSDFNAGYFDNAVYTDTTTNSGSIQLNFPDEFTSYRDGTNGTQKVWQTYDSASISGSTVVSVGTNLNISLPTGNSATYGVRTNLLNKFTYGTTYHVTITSMTYDVSAGVRFYIVLSSMTRSSGAGFSPYGDPSHFYCFFYNSSNTPQLLRVQEIANDIDGVLSNPQKDYPVPADINFYVSTNTYALTIGTTTVKNGSHNWTANKVYVYLIVQNITSPSVTVQYMLDNFSVAPTTMTYWSAVKNAPNLTSWDTLNITKADNGGSHSFYIRGSSTSIGVNSSTPAWTSITNGSIPSISTYPYFQIRDDFYSSTWTATPILYDFTQNWFEGNASDKSYATAFKDDIWWSVTSGAGATTNNKIIKLDLLNNALLLYDIASNGFYVRNNALYFGHSTTGNVFKFGGTNSDNGSAINSYWKSKDFFQDPFTTDDFTDASLFFKEVDNSTMTATFTVAGSSSSSYSIPCQRASATFGNHNFNLPQGTTGNTFNMKFGNNAADQPWEVFAAEFRSNPKSWKPGSQ